MNDKKLKQLFDAARNESAPAPSGDFAADVLRAIRQEPPVAMPQPLSLADQFNLLFPRIALASVAVIVLCVAADVGLTATGLPDLNDGVSQISAQWLLAPAGF